MSQNCHIGNVYHRDFNEDDIILDFPKMPASRGRSWIDVEQVEKEHWEVVDKIASILFAKPGKWTKRAVDFARTVLDFLVDHEFISWKQYDAVMGIKTIEEQNRIYRERPQVERLSHRQGIVTLNSGKKTMTFNVNGFGVIEADSLLGEMFKQASTDRDFDRLYEHVFGSRRYPENAEEDGTVFKYRDDGSRYESWMTDEEADDMFMNIASEGINF